MNSDGTSPAAVLQPDAAGTRVSRGSILRVRAGGDPRGAAITRCAAVLVAVFGAAGLLSWDRAGRLRAGPPDRALALRPPAPARLRRIGWTLVAVSIATLVLVVTS